MKTAIFDSHSFEKSVFETTNENFKHDLYFLESHLNSSTASLAEGFPCVCLFVNDRADVTLLKALKAQGTKLIALRCAGYNHVDLKAAREMGIKVVRVPEYSPYSVAEHAVALIQTLNRKTHRAYNRVREGNFSLNGLVGFDLHGKTVGVVGTGKIGKAFARIMHGFGCRVLLHDLYQDEAFAHHINASYVTQDKLFRESDIISLHVPLTPQSKHIISDKVIDSMKKGVMIINTGRGGLIDTRALIRGLKSDHIGSAGLDVYEEEEGVFFQDHSGEILDDDVLTRLMSFPNVLITGHQAFLTHEALSNIAETTLSNIRDFELGSPLAHEVT